MRQVVALSLRGFYEIRRPHGHFRRTAMFVGLKLSLAQSGRGVVIEGPTGIGKATALRKALAAISAEIGGASKELTVLSARNKSDLSSA